MHLHQLCTAVEADDLAVEPDIELPADVDGRPERLSHTVRGNRQREVRQDSPAPCVERSEDLPQPLPAEPELRRVRHDEREPTLSTRSIVLVICGSHKPSSDTFLLERCR